MQRPQQPQRPRNRPAIARGMRSVAGGGAARGPGAQGNREGGQRPRQQEAPADAGAAAPATQQPPPRKARRQPQQPNLSQAALAGKESLGTFAELAAFWEAKQKDEPAEAPVTNGSQETPPEENAGPT